jgi:hypothetical protein
VSKKLIKDNNTILRNMKRIMELKLSDKNSLEQLENICALACYYKFESEYLKEGLESLNSNTIGPASVIRPLLQGGLHRGDSLITLDCCLSG